MAIVDLERQGQCQVVCCSGVAQTGALSVLRDGKLFVKRCGVVYFVKLEKNYTNIFEILSGGGVKVGCHPRCAIFLSILKLMTWHSVSHRSELWRSARK
jgi:hypothetical protein